MAMIKCKECGKEMSEKARACPNCGARHETEESKAIRILIGLFILLISFFIFASGIKGIQKNNTNTNKTTVIKTTNKIK